MTPRLEATAEIDVLYGLTANVQIQIHTPSSIDVHRFQHIVSEDTAIVDWFERDLVPNCWSKFLHGDGAPARVTAQVTRNDAKVTLYFDSVFHLEECDWDELVHEAGDLSADEDDRTDLEFRCPSVALAAYPTMFSLDDSDGTADDDDDDLLVGVHGGGEYDTDASSVALTTPNNAHFGAHTQDSAQLRTPAHLHTPNSSLLLTTPTNDPPQFQTPTHNASSVDEQQLTQPSLPANQDSDDNDEADLSVKPNKMFDMLCRTMKRRRDKQLLGRVVGAWKEASLCKQIFARAKDHSECLSSRCACIAAKPPSIPNSPTLFPTKPLSNNPTVRARSRTLSADFSRSMGILGGVPISQSPTTTRAKHPPSPMYAASTTPGIKCQSQSIPHHQRMRSPYNRSQQRRSSPNSCGRVVRTSSASSPFFHARRKSFQGTPPLVLPDNLASFQVSPQDEGVLSAWRKQAVRAVHESNNL